MNSHQQTADETDDPIQYDPSYLNSLRELKYVAVIGTLALIWTVAYGGFNGYVSDAESKPLFFGMPSWVAWELRSWVITSLVTLWFAIFIIREDDDDLLDLDIADNDARTDDEEHA
ncbi:MAG: hypothetical protein R3C05_19445 [Pirellulaceae bacterium]